MSEFSGVISKLDNCFIILVGDPPFQMVELQLALFIEFPEQMSPGIFVVASDILVLFNSDGDLSFTKPGFTALAHPSPIVIGTTHGVFALSDGQASEVITSSNTLYNLLPQKTDSCLKGTTR